MLARALLAAVCTVLTCESRQGAMPQLTTFSELKHIQLGMTPAAVKAVRASVKLAPYVGLQEQLENYFVVYTFPRTEEEYPSELQRLQSVGLSRTVSSDSSAGEREWQEAVASTRTALGEPTACGARVKLLANARSARWQLGKQELLVELWVDEQSHEQRIVYLFQDVQQPTKLQNSTSCSALK